MSVVEARATLLQVRRQMVIRMNQLRDDAHDLAGEIDMLDVAILQLRREKKKK